MMGQLSAHLITGVASVEPMRQVLKKQVVAKFLTPARFEFGIRSRELARFRYAPGEMILCQRNIEEWVLWQTSARMLILEIPDEAFQSVAEETGGGEPELYPTPRLDDKRIGALMTAIEAEQTEGFPSGRVYRDAIAQALAAALFQAHGMLRRPMRPHRGGLAPRQLRTVIDYVQEYLDRDISLAQMAKAADLSPAYFSQMFRQSTGVAPHQFLLRARVDRAKELLQKPGSRVLDVAVSCGFRTQQHFSRVFRTLCKASPTEYRRDLGLHPASRVR
jgi:AraC family transcriptional regulator